MAVKSSPIENVPLNLTKEIKEHIQNKENYKFYNRVYEISGFASGIIIGISIILENLPLFIISTTLSIISIAMLLYIRNKISNENKAIMDLTTEPSLLEQITSASENDKPMITTEKANKIGEQLKEIKTLSQKNQETIDRINALKTECIKEFEALKQ